MGRIRGWVKKLERQARGEVMEIPQRDGTVRRFTAGRDGDLWGEVLVHEHARGKRHLDGEEPGPAHPVVEALRGASEAGLEELAQEYGTSVLHYVGEDEIYRGLRERPGPPVRETSPGVYE